MLVILAIICTLITTAQSEVIISSIMPPMGPMSGNTRVLVRGKGLSPNSNYPNPVCRFGSKQSITKGTYVKCAPEARGVHEPEALTKELTADCIRCDPNLPFPREDSVAFSVSVTGDFSDTKNSVSFNYYEDPVVDQITPIYGPKNGGTTVTVYGDNFKDFDNYLRCSFGTKSVQAQFINENKLYCVAPYSDTVIARMPFRVTMNNQQQTVEDTAYYYYPKPSIFTLIDNRGPLSGGNEVIVEGQDLNPFNDRLAEVNNHNDTYVRFGNQYTAPAKVISDTLLSVIAPPSPVVRTVPVDITLNNADTILNPQDWTDDFVPYTYYAMPYIFDINPRVGPTSGNTTVIAYGSNYNSTDEIKCKFGNKIVEGEFVALNEIKCISPAVKNPGFVDLSVSVLGDNFGKPVKYLYYETPIIESIEPICGPTTGYTQITVKGTNFAYTGHGMVHCIFGDIHTPATVMSSTELKCDSPDIHESKDLVKQIFFNVTVTLNGKDRSTYQGDPIVFGYYKFHTLLNVKPRQGPVTGYTPAIVYGRDFDQTATCNVTCRYGTTEVFAGFYDDKHVSCMTPPVSVPGHAITQVSLNGQQFTEYEHGENIGGSKYDQDPVIFTYYQPALITDFTPKSGPSSGNSTVSIYGAGFINSNETAAMTEIYVGFNNTETGEFIGNTKAYEINLNEIKTLTPAAPAGTRATLSISKNNVNFVPITGIGKTLSDNYYTYYEAPEVVSVNPNYGPVKSAKERHLTVSGRNFNCEDSSCDGLKCKFGTKPFPIFTNAEWINASNIKCVIPQLSRPEIVEVEVSLNGIDYTHNEKKYSYYDAFVLDIAPHIGKPGGGTPISVKGYGFADTGPTQLLCRFGSEEAPLLCSGKPCVIPGKYISDTEVICDSPPKDAIKYKNTGEGIGTDWFDVEVSVHDNEFTKNHIKFRYVDQPEVTSLYPEGGTANGGTYTIIGANFNDIATDTDQFELLEDFGIIKCMYVSGKHTEIVDGSLIAYPFDSDAEPNSVACVTPEWEGAGEVHIKIALNGRDFTGEFPFTFYDKIDEKEIYPKCGPNKGNTKVTIEGGGLELTDELWMKWGLDKRKVDQTSHPHNTTLTCHSAETPTQNTHGGFTYLELGVLNELEESNGKHYTFYGDFTQDRMLYMYYPDPVIKYINPHGGPSGGGSDIELAGAWFLNYPAMGAQPRARFGTEEVDCTFVNTVRVRCKTPKMNFASSVPLELTFNGQDWTESGQKFLFYNHPGINYIYPTSGSASGGAMVEVHGYNFTAGAEPGEFNCKYTDKMNGLKKIVPATFRSEDVIICATPGGWDVGNEAEIEVTFNGKDYTNFNNTFNFFKIDGVYPQAGPNTGSNQEIIVYGSGFAQNPNTTLYIDNNPISPTHLAWDEARFNIPSSKKEKIEGSVNFEVTMNGAEYTLFNKGFHYYRQPIVTDVDPVFGPISGKTPINIYGGPFDMNFQQLNTTCRIGNYVGQAKVINREKMHCVILTKMTEATNSTGMPIQVAMNGLDYTNNTHVYNTYGMMDISPKGGPIAGGTEVLVRGFGFVTDDSYKARCRFGIDESHIIVEGKVIDSKLMVCTSPSGFKVPVAAELPLDVPLEIGFSKTADDQTPWTNSDNKFRFYRHPTIISITPETSWIDEQIEVIIEADPTDENNFFPATTGYTTTGELDMMHALTARFGEYGIVPVHYLGETKVQILTPDTKLKRKAVSHHEVTVQLSFNGQDFFEAGKFMYEGTGSGFIGFLIWLGIIACIVIIVGLISYCLFYLYNNKDKFGNNDQPDPVDDLRLEPPA